MGIAQFMPGTARGMGVNPMDPVSALYGAARLDAQHLKAYGGDWSKALAAYNAGPGNVGHWQSIPETNRYVHKILSSAGMPSTGDLSPNTGGFGGLGTSNPLGTAASGGTALGAQQLVALTKYLTSSGQRSVAGLPPGDFPPDLLPTLTQGLGSSSGLDQFGLPGPATGTGLLGTRGKVIGVPGQGTHGKAFNQAGGSDNWQSENAIDISVPVGTPIYAPEAGVIDPTHYGSLGQGGRFAGLRVNLLGSNPLYFAHLSRIAVKPGQRVQRGQLIGYTGSSNGVAHLHFASRGGDPRQFYS